MSIAVARASQLLIEAHRRSRQIAAPPPDVAPITRAEAFAIQDRVVAALGGAGGWKTGAAGPEAEPTAAPLPAALIGPSPAELPAARFHAIGIEAEIALRLGQDLPARQRPYQRPEVLAAIESAQAAIEIVDSRLGAWARGDTNWRLADNQSNGYFVHGPPVTDWHGLDLAHADVELAVDGALAFSKSGGGNAAGDPLTLVVWLANHLAVRGSGLAAGDIVTTGSCSGLLQVRAGQSVAARFSGLDEASVQFSAP